MWHELNQRVVAKAYITAAMISLIGVGATLDDESWGVLAIGGGICVAILGRTLAKSTRESPE